MKPDLEAPQAIPANHGLMPIRLIDDLFLQTARIDRKILHQEAMICKAGIPEAAYERTRADQNGKEHNPINPYFCALVQEKDLPRTCR